MARFARNFVKRIKIRPCAKTFLAVVHLLDLSWKMRRAASSSFLSSSFRLWMVADESSEAVVRWLFSLGLLREEVTSSSSSSKRHWGLLDLLLDFRFRFFFFRRLSEVLKIIKNKYYFLHVHNDWKSPRMSHLKFGIFTIFCRMKLTIFGIFMNFCLKCRSYSLRSQFWRMRLFLWF